MGCLTPFVREFGYWFGQFERASTYTDDAALLSSVGFSAPAANEAGWPAIQADQMTLDERVHAAWMCRLEACLQYLKIPLIALAVAVCWAALLVIWAMATASPIAALSLFTPLPLQLEGLALAVSIIVAECIMVPWAYAAAFPCIVVGLHAYFHEVGPACIRIHNYAEQLFSEAARISG